MFELTPYDKNGLSIAGYMQLSEDAIKKAFIPHLKAFYRQRYVVKPGSESSSLDNVSDKGLVADGILHFQRGDGSSFVCAYEASSLDKVGEVKYSLNAVYFIWDCLAFAVLSTAVVYGWVYVTRLPWLAGMKFVGNLGLLLGVATIFFFVWYYGLQGWRKYRYIYAIEQFKRYYANEQWIALGEDVFPSPTDPYLLELKQQCIYNGFGLAIVYTNGAVRNIVTPSRLGIFGKDRKMVDWLTRNDWYQAMAQNMAFAARNKPEMPDQLQILWNKIWRPLRFQVLQPILDFVRNFLKEPLNNSNTTYERYMQGRSVQQWIFGFGILALSLIGFYVSQYSTESYIDPKTLLEQKNGPNPEDQPGYIMDDEPVPFHPGGIPKQYPAHNKSTKKEAPEEIQVINLSGEE